MATMIKDTYADSKGGGHQNLWQRAQRIPDAVPTEAASRNDSFNKEHPVLLIPFFVIIMIIMIILILILLLLSDPSSHATTM